MRCESCAGSSPVYRSIKAAYRLFLLYTQARTKRPIKRFSSKKVWIFMITMQNYCTRLPATFIGDGYSSWLLYSKGNSKRETGTVEFHSLNLVGFWK